MSGAKQKDVVIIRQDKDGFLAGKYWGFTVPPAEEGGEIKSYLIYYRIEDAVKEAFELQVKDNKDGNLSGKYFTFSNKEKKFCVYFITENQKKNEIFNIDLPTSFTRDLGGKFFRLSNTEKEFCFYFIVESKGKEQKQEIIFNEQDITKYHTKYFLFNTVDRAYAVYYHQAENEEEIVVKPNIDGREVLLVKYLKTETITLADLINRTAQEISQTNAVFAQIDGTKIILQQKEPFDVVEAKIGTCPVSVNVLQKGINPAGKRTKYTLEILQHGPLSAFCDLGNGTVINIGGSNKTGTSQTINIETPQGETTIRIAERLINALKDNGYTAYFDTSNPAKVVFFDKERRKLPTKPSSSGNGIKLEYEEGQNDILGEKPNIGADEFVEIRYSEFDTYNTVLNYIKSAIDSKGFLTTINNKRLIVDSRAVKTKSRASADSSGFGLAIEDGLPETEGSQPNLSGYELIPCRVKRNATALEVASVLAQVGAEGYSIAQKGEVVSFVANEAWAALESLQTQTSGFTITKYDKGKYELIGDVPQSGNDIVGVVIIPRNASVELIITRTVAVIRDICPNIGVYVEGDKIYLTREDEGEAKISQGSTNFGVAVIVKGKFPPKPSQNWKQVSVKTPIPQALKPINNAIRSTKNTLSPALKTLATLLDAAKVFYLATSDPFKAAAEKIITELESAIHNLFDSGLHMLVISPLEVGNRSIYLADKLASAKDNLYLLQEKARDYRIKGDNFNAAVIEAEILKTRASIGALQALGVSVDSDGFPLLRPADIIYKIIESLDDEGDAQRPYLDKNTQISALGFILTAPDKSALYDLLDTFLNIFSIEDLENLKFHIEFNFIKPEKRKKPNTPSTPPDWRSWKLSNVEVLAETRDVLLDALNTARGFMVTADESLLRLIDMLREKIALLEDLINRLDKITNAINLGAGIYVYKAPMIIGKDNFIDSLFTKDLMESKNGYSVGVMFLATDAAVPLMQSLIKLL